MRELKSIEKKIKNIKTELMNLGDMHPGSLSMQFNICGEPTCSCKDKKDPQKHGPYYNLSYSIRGRSTSRFIREENVKEIEKQVKNYQSFRELTTEWKNLAAEHAKLKHDLAKEVKKKTEKA